MRPNRFSMLRTALGIALIAMTATAASAADFYKGKTVRIIVGSSPGGGFDTYARLVGRHIGKHIPGAPRTLVTTMPGAGNLIAANFMYNKAKPDGLTVGHWVGGLVLSQALGLKGVKFDARKFEWIGVPKPSYIACVVAKDSGITNMDDWMASKKRLKMGGMAPGSSISDIPRLLERLTGVPLHLIEGVRGRRQHPARRRGTRGLRRLLESGRHPQVLAEEDTRGRAELRGAGRCRQAPQAPQRAQRHRLHQV